MAAPNIVNVATITAKTDTALLTGTSATAALSTAASSGKVLKVNSLSCCNKTIFGAFFASLCRRALFFLQFCLSAY